MARQITVVLLDKTDSSTERYLELTRELLERLLKPSGLWVAEIAETAVIDSQPQKTETAIVRV